MPHATGSLFTTVHVTALDFSVSKMLRQEQILQGQQGLSAWQPIQYCFELMWERFP